MFFFFAVLSSFSGRIEKCTTMANGANNGDRTDKSAHVSISETAENEHRTKTVFHSNSIGSYSGYNMYTFVYLFYSY